MGSIQNFKTCSELKAICLQTLRTCPGFEMVNEIVVRSNDVAKRDGGTVSDRTTNWMVAAVKPRVDNQSLRGARDDPRTASCNWMVRADAGDEFCVARRHNRHPSPTFPTRRIMPAAKLNHRSGDSSIVWSTSTCRCPLLEVGKK